MEGQSVRNVPNGECLGQQNSMCLLVNMHIAMRHVPNNVKIGFSNSARLMPAIPPFPLDLPIANNTIQI